MVVQALMLVKTVKVTCHKLTQCKATNMGIRHKALCVTLIIRCGPQ